MTTSFRNLPAALLLVRRPVRRARARALRLVALALMTVATSLVVVASSQSSASAVRNDPPYILRNVYTNRCLDDSNYGLRTFACNGTNFQRWIRFDDYRGTALQNAATGRCLDDSRYGLRTFACNNTDFQRFYIDYDNYFIRNDVTNACVDDSDAYGVRGFPCNYTNFQAWWRDQG